MKRIFMLIAASFMAMILAACGGESGERKDEDKAKPALEQAQDKMDEAKDKVEEAQDKMEDKKDEQKADQKADQKPAATTNEPAENTTTY